MRTEYWLSVDGKKTTALIEKEFGQGAWYKYSVDGKEYQNESQRNWDPDVGVGHESVVFFSSSHPWLSSLTTPRFEPAEAVVLFFAFPVELLLIVTVLSPRSPWAMKILQKCESKDKT